MDTTLSEYDARWAGDNGATISTDSKVDENCAPACTPDFHVC